ncbi:hypothetical protein niasHT_012102 [Heterodera trifolii]|uniref:Uncharacterized protein n=1 Tax=Heterodera trifolii TaxID=157864 RepID=A0ABD2LA52_9BILA
MLATPLFLFLINQLLLIGAVVGNDQPIAPTLIEKLRSFLNNMLDTVIQIEEANSRQLIVNNEQQQRFGINDIINAALTADQYQPAQQQQQQHIAQFGPSAPPLSDGAQFGSNAPPLSDGAQFGSSAPPLSDGAQFGSNAPPLSDGAQFGPSAPPLSDDAQFGPSAPPLSDDAQFGPSATPLTSNFSIIGCDVDMEKLEHICNTIQTFEVLKCLASEEKQKHYAKNLNKYLSTQTDDQLFERLEWIN